MKNLFIVSAVIFLFSSCSQNREAEIRIKNTSTYTYDSVYVNTNGGEHVFGSIAPGAASPYHEFDYAYSYAYIRLKIDTAVYTLQPIDYVGERKLKTGKYTYEISVIDTTYNQLGINLVED